MWRESETRSHGSFHLRLSAITVNVAKKIVIRLWKGNINHRCYRKVGRDTTYLHCACLLFIAVLATTDVLFRKVFWFKKAADYVVHFPTAFVKACSFKSGNVIARATRSLCFELCVRNFVCECVYLSDDYVCQDFLLTFCFNMAGPFLQSQQIAWTNRREIWNQRTWYKGTATCMSGFFYFSPVSIRRSFSQLTS